MRFRHQKKARKKRLNTRQDRIMTLANAISFSRIFLAIPLVLLFEEITIGETGKYWGAFGLIIIIVYITLLQISPVIIATPPVLKLYSIWI